MKKTIIIKDLADDYLHIQMQEDFKDSTKYLPPKYQELVELRHQPPSDDFEGETERF